MCRLLLNLWPKIWKTVHKKSGQKKSPKLWIWDLQHLFSDSVTCKMVSFGVFHRFKWKMPYFFHFWNKPFGICLARWEKIDFQGPFSFKKTSVLEQAPTKTHVWCIFSAPASLCGFFKQDLWDTPGVAAQNSGGGGHACYVSIWKTTCYQVLRPTAKDLWDPRTFFQRVKTNSKIFSKETGAALWLTAQKTAFPFFFSDLGRMLKSPGNGMPPVCRSGLVQLMWSGRGFWGRRL